MAEINRLPAPYGLLLNRQQVITFSFNNNHYECLAGDCIASALAANDQWLLSRSFKYHRPRGVLTMAGQDANTLVQLPANPNVLADREPVREGMQVAAQNISGKLENDRASWIGRFAKFLPVGFYYRAFYKPRGIWEKWAPLVRKKAGLGIIDKNHQPEYFDKQYLFYDVVIVGGGPAGMSAAIAAAKSGAAVLLVDESPVLGGSLNYARLDAQGQRAQELRIELINEVNSYSKIDVMLNAVCNGWHADNWLPIVQTRRLYKVRAVETIMCVGSLEQPALFHCNDLPGIMLGSAAQRLLHLYGVRPGKAAVVLAGNNEAYAVALDLLDVGVDVKSIVELRKDPHFDECARSVINREIPVKTGHAIFAAATGHDRNHLGQVDIRKVVADGKCDTQGEVIECDLLCMSVGFMPAYQLPCQAGGQLSYDDDHASFTLDKLPNACRMAGSVTGSWDIEQTMEGARVAGVVAGNNTTGAGNQTLTESSVAKKALELNFPWPIFPHPDGKEFVDFDEDLQVSDIVNAVADGYEHIQLVKRYSTCGMGPSQGRHSALAAARLVAKETGKTVADTGVTTARPPFTEERLAHSAGRSFYPARRSNIHHRHLEAGAQMLHAGAWFRPAFYGPKSSREQTIQKEVQNVRNNVGLVDVSTLGGMEIRGPDASEFLNRIYTSSFVKQRVGRAGYALLTNEAGVVIDDGVVCRFREHHYYVTTTTGGADRVYQTMLKWNAQWRLDVDIANVTSAWCGVNVAGPKARAVLQPLCPNIDLSATAFPYMGVLEDCIDSIPARLIRVGFVGELGYEIHVPQHFGEALWDKLMKAGADHQIAPFGIEAQRILRLEKGHIIVGQDTDALSNPLEVQMGWAVAHKKPFFVGNRTIRELEKSGLERSLVGFVVNDPQAPIPLESHLLLEGETMVGRVTSCEFSPTLGKPVGLAYTPVKNARTGMQIVIKSSGGTRVRADIVELPFYDPDGHRQEL